MSIPNWKCFSQGLLCITSYLLFTNTIELTKKKLKTDFFSDPNFLPFFIRKPLLCTANVTQSCQAWLTKTPHLTPNMSRQSASKDG